MRILEFAVFVLLFRCVYHFNKLDVKFYFCLVSRSIRLFSNTVINGTIIIKCAKYIAVDICPNSIKGDSTCLAPNCIKIKKLATNTKNAILLKGLNCIPLNLDRSVNGMVSKANIAENIAITPRSLLGIDLKMA